MTTHTPTNNSSIVRERTYAIAKYPDLLADRLADELEEVVRQLAKAKRATKWEPSHKWNRRSSR